MAHVQNAFAGLAHHSESIGQKVLERLASFESLFEFGGFGLELFVGEGWKYRDSRALIC